MSFARNRSRGWALAVVAALTACAERAEDAPAAARAAARAAPRPAPAARVNAAPPPRADAAPVKDEDTLGALLAFVDENDSMLDDTTRPLALDAIDRAIARAARASGADDLPRAAQHNRTLQLAQDGVFARVHKGIVLAHGTARVEDAEDAIIVATDAAFVKSCKGCVVLAGRLAVVDEAMPAPDGARALVWSAAALEVDDASGTIVAGPKADARARGVVRADPAVLGASAARTDVAPPALRVTGTETDADGITWVTLANEGGAAERVSVGGVVRGAPSNGVWRVVQAYGAHVALRSADGVAFLTVDD